MPLFCMVCQAPLSESRARRPQTSVCSERCKNKLDTERARQRQQKKCPHCLAPSTPEERLEFRAFRKSRGDVKNDVPQKRDTAWPPRTLLQTTLRAATRDLEALVTLIPVEAPEDGVETIAEGSAQPTILIAKAAEVRSRIEPYKKFLDTKAAE
jgi:hypothetical protein